MAKAECLPTEIWFEIFSYLSSNHNIRAFSSLNQFFDRFTLTKYFGVHHQPRPENCLPISSKHFIPSPRLETIRSLTPRQQTAKCLIVFLHLYSNQLINLQKLSIYLKKQTLKQINLDLIDILQRLPSLKSLQIRSIISDLHCREIVDLLRIVFSDRLALTHCRLLFSFNNFSLHLIRWVGTPAIRCLALGAISWQNLLVLLSQTRHLVVLEAFIVESKFEPSTLVLSSLRKVILDIRETPFDLLEEIRRLAPHLNFFSVRGLFLSNDESYVCEDLWKKLLNRIPSYEISLRTLTFGQDEKERMQRIHDSLEQNQWLKLTDNRSSLCVDISFQSK